MRDNKFKIQYRLWALLFLVPATAFLVTACLGSDSGSSGSSSTSAPVPAPTPPTTTPPAANFAVSGSASLTGTGVTSSSSLSSVPVDATIVIPFNSAIDANSIIVNSTPSLSSVAVTSPDSSGGVLSTFITASVVGNTIQVKAESGFLGNQAYTLTISTGLTDTAGAKLSQSYQLNFTTALAPGQHAGDQVTVTIVQDNFATQDPNGWVNSFQLFYGTQSQSDPGFTAYQFPQNPSQPIVLDITPAISGPLTTSTQFTAVYKTSFTSNTLYYFSIKACGTDGACSAYSAEASLQF